MRKLSGIIFVLCIACLFSIQAGAVDSSVQIQKRQQYVPPAPQPRFVQRPQNVLQPTTQWVTHSVQQTNVQYSQSTQQSGTSVGGTQDLKQFGEQTQQQMADFRKL